jgi:hypothetical protein
MHSFKLAAAALLCSASLAGAASETHSVPYSYSLATSGDVPTVLMLPGFDTQNGKRTLTRVDIRVQADVSATLSIENMTSAPLSNWTLEGQHVVLAAMEREGSKEPGPFAFAGGLNIPSFTSPLGASDGVAGSGPDFFSVSDSTTIDSLLEMDSSYLSFFKGGGEIKTLVGPFTESFLGEATHYDPKTQTGDAVVGYSALEQAGTFSLIYEYTAVPEPTSALMLAGLMAIARRRA